MRYLKQLSMSFFAAVMILSLTGCEEFINSLTKSIADQQNGGGKQVTLSWDSPTTRTDGKCLNGQLAGYLLSFQGQNTGAERSARLPINSGEMSCSQTSENSACGEMSYKCSHTVTGLATDDWTFAVIAYDSGERQSPKSNLIKLSVQ